MGRDSKWLFLDYAMCGLFANHELAVDRFPFSFAKNLIAAIVLPRKMCRVSEQHRQRQLSTSTVYGLMNGIFRVRGHLG